MNRTEREREKEKITNTKYQINKKVEVARRNHVESRKSWWSFSIETKFIDLQILNLTEIPNLSKKLVIFVFFFYTLEKEAKA